MIGILKQHVSTSEKIQFNIVKVYQTVCKSCSYTLLMLSSGKLLLCRTLEDGECCRDFKNSPTLASDEDFWVVVRQVKDITEADAVITAMEYTHKHIRSDIMQWNYIDRGDKKQ